MFCRRLFLWMMAAALIGSSAACGGSSEVPTQPTPPPPTGPATLQITDLVVGEGTEVVSGSTVIIHYRLWHYDPNGTDSKGTLIQDSRAQGFTFTFIVGATSGQFGTIPGMSQGATGMRVGGQRRMIIPPSLAYGATGDGRFIAPNEWIVFDVEVLASVNPS